VCSSRADKEKITGGVALITGTDQLLFTLSKLRLAGAVRGTRGETAAAILCAQPKKFFDFHERALAACN
jgi:hypothetical protein